MSRRHAGPSADGRPSAARGLEAVAAAPHGGALAETAARIGLAVDLHLLQPDERLPDEQELALTFGVSRMTTRRALTFLSEQGILVRRRGRAGGTFVARQPPSRALRGFADYRTASAEVIDLIDHRLVIECGAVYLAAERARPADIDQLRRLVRAMDEAETWTAFRAVDPVFHLTVASLSGSSGAADALAQVLRRLFRFYVPYPIAYLHASNREHEALVNALAAGDRASAVEVIRRHIDELRDTVFVEPRSTARPKEGHGPRTGPQTAS